MFDYFKVPSHNSTDCVTLSSPQSEYSQIYIYSDNFRVQNTYSLINYKWVRTATRSSTNPINNSSLCELNNVNYYVPQGFSQDLFIGSILCCLVLSVGLFKVFKR